MLTRAEFREISEPEFDDLAVTLQDHVVRIAKEFAGRVRAKDDFELSYDLDQGSLVTLAKIFGALMATYVAISQYPSFRNGVIQLYDDARSAGQAIIEEFKNVTGVKDQHISYKRTTPRDVNRLFRIVSNIDKVEQNRSDPVIRERIIADIARLHRANATDQSIQQVLDIIPRDQLPPIPHQIEDVLELDERKRWSDAISQIDTATGKRLSGGRPWRLPIRQLNYHRTIRI